MLSSSIDVFKSKVQWLFVIGLLILLNCNCESEAALFDGCDNVYNLNAGYSYLESPYYPNSYPSGSSCRYKFVAPLDYTITANCTINLDKGTNACSTEFFYLARDGDLQLRGAEQFCGRGSIIRTSVFRSMTLAYISYGSRGNFRCVLFAQPQPCDCGWSVNTKIMNGQETGVNEYPAMAALKDITDIRESFCGASIISHRFLITAAHCTAFQPVASNIVALVGDHNLASNNESRYAAQYAIAQIINHPDYSSNPTKNDIALLRTVNIIEWSRGVGPICLPSLANAQNTFEYNYVDLLGWGTRWFGGPVSDTLQKINLLILTNNVCQEKYQGYAVISGSEMCTYDPSGNSKDTCQLDSGGPVILRASRMFLLGIISFGKFCGQDGYPVGVNTRVTSYLQWIQQNTGYSTCNVAM